LKITKANKKRLGIRFEVERKVDVKISGEKKGVIKDH